VSILLSVNNDSGVIIELCMDEGYSELIPGGGLTGGQYALKLRYDGITPTDPSILRIIKAPDPHTTWVADGVHGGLVAPNSVTRTGMSGFSWFVLYTGEPSSLPVELTNLSAECKSNGIGIHWTTASENNSSSFEIERSLDGVAWENIGSVPAAGNSNQLLHYSFLDPERIQGINYYQLRQLDIDGAEKVYGPISMSCFDGLSEDIVAYPNPNNGTFTVEFESSLEQANAKVELKDVLGQVIQSRNVAVYNGVNQVMFEMKGLNPGEYVVTVSTENGLKMVKVVVM